ncbi:MAG TPA: Fic family protein [Polyangiaceae bacterium]|nr:Fic family protein [Polyangiaceae bacterium]
MSAKRKAPKAAPRKAAAKNGKDRKRAAQAALRDRIAKKRLAERARKERDRERLQAQKERQREQAQRQREREQEQRERQREQARLKREREQERVAAQKEKQRQALERNKQRAKDAKAKQAEQNRKRQDQERAKKAAAKERERLAKQRDKDRVRLKSEREAQKAQQRIERAAAKEREKLERQQERVRLKSEREAERQREREEAQKKRDAEQAAKKAAQDAYRKAKDAEKARIRAEREAARRALELRVAKAAGRGMRGGMRSPGVRVYSPTAIPNQAGTSRVASATTQYAKFANLRPPRIDSALEARPRTVPPPAPVAPPESIEERYALVQQRLAKMDAAFRKEHEESMLMSWIYHDSALEGSVYTFEELRAAITPDAAIVPDSSMQTAVEQIRRHKAAIDLVVELGDKRRAPVTVDVVKRLYLVLNPEEGDLKTVKYRKDIPQHRLYFHEYAAPDKIAYKVRQVFDWLAGPEPKKLKSPLKVAARVHYDLLRVFPFPLDSGKVARLLMNILLLRADYPPALIHSTERQRYYEALRGSLTTIVAMLQESIQNAMQSIEKKLDEAETRMRTFGS